MWNKMVSKFNYIYLVVCVCLWWSKDNGQNLPKSALYFYWMGSGDETQGVRLGGRHLYPLSQTAGCISKSALEQNAWHRMNLF